MAEYPSGNAQPEAPADAASGGANNGSVEQGSVSRRHILSGGAAAVIAATAAVTGNVDEALASTRAKKNGASRKNGSSRKKGSGKTTINVNGRNQVVTDTHDTMLLYVLRDTLGLRGPKFGCGLSQCGACAVLADGQQIRSCVTPLSTVGTKKITTLDGLAATYHGKAKAEQGHLHPLQQAWIDEQVPQCGYCQPGQIMSAAALLAQKFHPTDAEIDEAMAGNICRCATYFRIRKAIHRAAEESRL